MSIAKICEIGWPSKVHGVEEAKQAETLFLAKDKLNAAAKPANGASIAFTLMVVGEENLQVDFPDRGVQHGDREKTGWLGEYKTPPTRIYLAHRAFPGLISSAAEFRKRIRRLIYILSTFLLLTCALSWYVAAGNIILTHLDAAHQQEREIRKKVALMVTSSMTETPNRSEKATAEKQAEALAKLARMELGSAGFADPAYSLENCKSYVDRTFERTKAAEPFQICDTLGERISEHDAVGRNLGRWLLWMGAAGRPFAELHATDEEFGRTLSQVLISSVLPFFYGILGAAAAIVRDLWAKMRESLLSPRDYTLAIGQLALGAIIGACISLFINPSVAGASNENILGGFVLTGSALSFVAGFGVEGVFQALEGLVRRVFNNADPKKIPAQ